MKKAIDFNQVADIYDVYVNVDTDIPFFLRETENIDSEILELMCGTGRVSIPLLASGRKLTCVDYSDGMLEVFAKKVKNQNYDVRLIQMDITRLDLKKKFKLILLPFHSITEILSTELQRKALKTISLHLEKDGIFILTLQNPNVRLKLADGITKPLGTFQIEQNREMKISYMNQYDQEDKVVSGFQCYETFNSENILIEKRVIEINFKPISDSELKNMIKNLDLEIIETYGDYSYSPFVKETSNFIIYKMVKK